MRHGNRKHDTTSADIGRSGRRAGAVLVACAALLAPAPSAIAQQTGEAEPLSKSQIVRRLATTPNQQERIAERIEEVCLSFEPTRQDIADLRAVGAERSVIEAVRTCESDGENGSLTASLRRASAVGAGDTATIVVRLQGESRSPGGVSVHVTSPGEGPGRQVQVQAADTTDQAGRATLRVPANRMTTTDSLLLSSPEVALRGDTLVILRRRADASDTRETAPAGNATSGSAAAQRGASQLRSGRPFAAVLSYRTAVEESDGGAGSWAGLGRAWLAAGFPVRARHAVHRAVEMAPDSREARESLARLRTAHPRYRLTVAGGRTVEGSPGGGAAPLRLGSIALRPAPAVHLRAGYDDALGRHFPALVRGGAVRPETLYGGIGYDWGADKTLTTRFEAGRRQRSAELVQMIYRIEQTVRLGWEGWPLDLTVGGLVGRWYDRDDWLVYGEFTVPVSPDVRLRPRLSLGTTVGTAFPDTLRRVARDARAGLTVEVRPVPRLQVVTSGTFGKVGYRARARGYEGWNDVGGSGSTADSGTLLDLGLRASGRFYGSQRAFVDVRHQSPPVGDSFTSLAAGVTLSLP